MNPGSAGSAAKLAPSKIGAPVKSAAARTAQLDPRRRSPQAKEFSDALRSRVVGQDAAIEKVSEIYQMFLAGLHPPRRPIGNLLFLGPTGSGKTRVVEATAEALFGDARACIKVDCAEFQHSHEIAKLIGSPPGYLGHRETHPLITQEALSQFHTEKLKLSILLFDEIEKSSDALWQLLLGILDKATLTLGDNRRVDLSQTIIFLTSNLGAGDMQSLQEGGGIGFGGPVIVRDEVFDQKIQRTAADAAKRKFAPEFINRIDKMVVFNTLRDEHLKEILKIELGMVQDRILTASNTKGFLIHATPLAGEALLLEGTDPKYGARHLKRAIEKNIVHPLANLVATNQILLGDVIEIGYEGDLPLQGKAPVTGEYVFTKRQEGVQSLINESGAIGTAAEPSTRVTTPQKKM